MIINDLAESLKQAQVLQDNIIKPARYLVQGGNKRIQETRINLSRLLCRYDARHCDLVEIFKSSDNKSYCRSFLKFIEKNRSNTSKLTSGRRGESDDYSKMIEYLLVHHGEGCITFDVPDNYQDFFVNRAKDSAYVRRAYEGKKYLLDLSETFEEFSNPSNLWREFRADGNLFWKLHRGDYLALQALPAAYRTSLEASRPFLGDEFVNKALTDIPADRSPATRESEDALGLGKGDIRDIQARLNATGAQIAVNGAMGAAARAALRQWQGALGYDPTGFLNQVQLNELRERTKDRVALAPSSPSLKRPSANVEEAPPKPARRQAKNTPRRNHTTEPIRQRRESDGAEVLRRILVPLIDTAVRRCAFARCF